MRQAIIALHESRHHRALAPSGKSTLFQLLTGGLRAARRAAARRPAWESRAFPTLRVDALAELFNPKKKTLATVEYVDVPGVAKGEGPALVDLPALRGVDALVHVVRAFESEWCPTPTARVDALRDAKMLELELILADLATVERRLERLEANIKKANKAGGRGRARAVPASMKQALEAERPLRELELTERTSAAAAQLRASCPSKPVLLVANLGEEQIREAAACARALGPPAATRAGPGSALCPVAAPIEAEMAELSAGGRAGLPRGPGARRARASTA